MKLPTGYSYKVDQGADTFVGHFTSPDSRIIIQHDIGGYAGAWAKQKQSILFRQTTVSGARVWVAHREWPDGNGGETTLMAVTFPDSGCANFYLTSSDRDDGNMIDFIAKRFRPRGGVAHSSFCP